MGRVPYSEFIGSRARFQRLSDQRVFAGWLQELRNDGILVVAEESIPVAPSERFLFQVQGPSADAYFIATSTCVPVGTTTAVHGATAKQIVELPAQNYEFTLITQIQMRDAQQHARRSIEAMVGTLHACGNSSEVLISDASAGGMGVIVWQELKKGDVVGVDVKSDEVDLSFTCEVRHCRPEPRLIGAYRVGLRFQNSDRLALVSWRKLTRQA